MQALCDSCHEKSLFLCGCRKANYCSKDCQLLHRINHKKLCDIIRKCYQLPGYNDTYQLTDEMLAFVKSLYASSTMDAICIYSQYLNRPTKFNGKIFKFKNVYHHFFLIPFPEFKQASVPMKKILDIMEEIGLANVFEICCPIFKLTLKKSTVDKISFCLLQK